jgi:Putative mono-oxygenase ydhR
MVTAFVQFRVPAPMSRERAKEVFSGTAPNYQKVQGLIRKYYLLSEDGGTAGGVYLWQSKEDAKKLYTQDWKKFVKEKYGAEPSITYFHSPVIVDNLTREIIKD